MHTQTMNMFAETNEDMPIISGVGRTEVVETKPQPSKGEWTEDGMDGYFNGCALQITATTTGSYRTEVRKNDYLLGRAIEPTLKSAHKFAIFIATTRANRI